MFNKIFVQILNLLEKNTKEEIAKLLIKKENSKKIFLSGLIILVILLNVFSECLYVLIHLNIKFNIIRIFIPRLRFLPVYFLFFVIYIIYYFLNVRNFQRAFKDLNEDQKGSSRFAKIEEIESEYRSVYKKEKVIDGKGGIPVSRNIKKDEIFIDDSPVNNLIIGMTRSGKGQMFVLPMIDIYSRANEKSSMIIMDVKGELIASSKKVLEKRGFEVLVLNLLEPEKSMSFNPLYLVLEAYKNNNISEAQLLCKTITHALYNSPNSKDKFWENSAKALVNALILALCEECIENHEEEKVTFFTVANMLTELGSRYIEREVNDEVIMINALDDYFDNMREGNVAKLQYSLVRFSKSNTRQSILSTTMEGLSNFTLDSVARLTSIQSIDFKEIGFKTRAFQKPKIIFMVIPDYDSSNAKLISIFIDQLYYVLAREASKSNLGKCEREVVFLLDEFGNIPQINDMANKMTVCLGRNIKFNLILQSYEQLEEKYKNQSETIIGNCGNQIYILSNSFKTKQKFSKLLGEETQIIKSRSGNLSSLNKNYNESVSSRPLLYPTELNLQEGESIICRVMKRTDLNLKKITPYPIFNRKKYSMQYAYEYLNDTFSIEIGLKNVDIKCIHKDVDLSKLIFIPIKYKKEKEEDFYIEENEVIKNKYKYKISKILEKDNYSNKRIEQIKECKTFRDLKFELDKYNDMDLYCEIIETIQKQK